MLSKESLPALNKREVCIDIATGTGFLAKHFSGLFQKSFGTDLSEA
jgi:ubiquinone/menaquinone biosynthesis C-methylase UbiE